jgi:hypothetical protein
VHNVSMAYKLLIILKSWPSPAMTQFLHSNLSGLDIYNHVAQKSKNPNFKHNTEKTGKNPVII